MDIKYLSSAVILTIMIGGLVFAAEDRYVTEQESAVQMMTLKSMIRQKQLDDLSDDIDYLSDKKMDSEISRSEMKKLERLKRRLDTLIKGK